MASSRNPFFFCCFEQRCKPSPSPVFPAFTNLGQTGGTKGASNAIRCRFFRSPARCQRIRETWSRKTALPCSFSQAPAMTVTNSMDAGDARGFTAPSFACDRQPAYPATGFTSSARKAVCQDTYLHPLSQQVTAKISPLSTARFSGTQVATPSPDEALPSPSVTSCSAENSIRTDHPHGMLCPDTLLLLREERFL